MHTLPTSELGFKYWLKVIVVIATFCVPLIYYLALFDYTDILGNFIAAPVDYGSCGPDPGYEMARVRSRIVTTITLFITTFLAFKLVFRSGSSKITAKDILRGLALQYSYPIAVHLITTLPINNYSGL